METPLEKHMIFDPIISLLENFTINTLEKLHQDVRIHRTLYEIKNQFACPLIGKHMNKL